MKPEGCVEADSERALAKELCCPVRALLAAWCWEHNSQTGQRGEKKIKQPQTKVTQVLLLVGGRDGLEGGAGACGLTLWEGRLGYKSEKVSLQHLG